MFVLGAQKNRLIETVLFANPLYMFWLRNKKNNFQLCTLILRPELMYSKTRLKWTLKNRQNKGLKDK